MSYDSAKRFMNVAETFGGRIAHGAELESLNPGVLYALASPTTTPEVRTEVIERAAAGETVTVALRGNRL
ncbi:hypothetical protein [Bradyrhizobium macuxiense]|uniref:hypothetical protein n=1 Tax=Bradyrhizobium macuxiense TaxID=1755647 RepID=UPI000A80E073|nr:hypothetical protein [Bradyrhizobium macuxiense]